MAYDLLAIRNKVRKLTGRNSPTQLTDAEIDDYINQYYIFEIPESLKFLKLKDVYTFTTDPHIDTYAAPSNLLVYYAPPVTCAGIRIDYFNNNETFYTRWPKRNFVEIVGTGNGTPGPYVGNISNVPFLRSVNPSNAQNAIGKVQNVLFTGQVNAATPFTTTATDDGLYGLLAPAIGGVDYESGLFQVTFPQPINAGSPIWAETVPYIAARPTSLMYWQNQFVVRPVPDNSYIMEINMMRNPTSLINDLDQPELLEWWKLLAYGAANQILIDNGDYEILTNLRPQFEEQILLAQRRVIIQGTSQRAATLFSENNQYPFGNNYPYI
jgi:hypothetical protein